MHGRLPQSPVCLPHHFGVGHSDAGVAVSGVEWTHRRRSGPGGRPVAPGKCPQLTQDEGKLGGAWQTHHTPICTSPLNLGVDAGVPLPDLGVVDNATSLQ